MTDATIVSFRFTILFEDPYWVGLCERHDADGYAVARTVFGAEPTAPEVEAYVRAHYRELKFSAPQPEPPTTLTRSVNFKRAQREARAEQAAGPKVSKAHEAMRLELEKQKKERKVETKAEREAEASRQRQLRIAKNKARHRGH